MDMDVQPADATGLLDDVDRGEQREVRHHEPEQRRESALVVQRGMQDLGRVGQERDATLRDFRRATCGGLPMQ